MSFHIFQSLIGKDLKKLAKTLVEKGEFELFFYLWDIVFPRIYSLRSWCYKN